MSYFVFLLLPLAPDRTFLFPTADLHRITLPHEQTLLVGRRTSLIGVSRSPFFIVYLLMSGSTASTGNESASFDCFSGAPDPQAEKGPFR
jgi:hypothetical protein